MELETTQTSTMLKQGDYEMWRLRIEQYFHVHDYALWDVIESRNSFVLVTQTTTTEGGAITTTISSHVTAEEKIKKKNDVKVRSMLLMALPNEHLMTSNQYKDAKSLFAAIETRFGGNEATKKTQKTLLKQMYENFSATSTVNKPGLDIMSTDDLYNNFKIFEQEVKGNASSNSSSQNMAFVSSSSTNSTMKFILFMDLVLLALNLVLLALKGHRNQDSRNRYQDSSRRTVHVEETPPKAMIVIDGVGFDWSYMAEDEVPTNMDLMAFSDSESPVMVEKKTVVPTVAKVEDVKPKQQEKPVKKTVRPRAVNTARPNSAVVNDVRANQGHPQNVQEDQGYVDSGCSRHMTWNVSYIYDFKEFDGGCVTFRGGVNGGRITGKETLKTGNLDFEDVYFVKELKFNLLSVSQMCDKKNSVLFTDTRCFVLSPDFKLADESQVLLKVPRKNNMYSVDMKNIVLKESLTCLVTKATLDESMLWHRRLGIRREFSVARTPRQNDVAERRNKILIEDARTILADSKLPTTFLAEVVNTACYVQNRALVVKPHNKTPYELFRGAGPKWIFDIDMLTKSTKSMNYVLVIVGTKDSIGAGQSNLETGSTQDYIFMPLWKDGLPLCDSSPKISGDARKKHDEVSNKYSEALNELNSAFENLNTEYPDDLKMPGLETIATYDDSDKESDFTNLESSIHVSPTPTTRTHKNHPLKQMDVKSDLLYERIKEDVYVCQPPGFEDPDHPDKVYKVELCTEFERLMKDKFQMSSMGELTFFLGLQVKQKEDGIFISQDKYIAEVFRKFNFSDVKTASTPVDMENTLVKDADGDDCKKQTVVATYTIEAEYVATASCCGQVLRIQNQMLDYSTKLMLLGKLTTAIDVNVVEVNPTIYTSCIKQFWATIKVKTIDGEEHIQTLVDKKKVIITETSVRKDLHLKDVEAQEDMGKDLEIPTDSHHTPTINQPSTSYLPQKKQKSKKSKKKITKVPQLSDSTNNVADEHVTTTSNDPLLSAESSLGDQEDASKQRRIIDNLDADEGVTLVDETQGRNDQDMFDKCILDDEEVVVEKEVTTADPVTTPGEVVTTVGVEVSTAAITPQISMDMDEITLAKALIDIKTSKPKAKGIVMQEPSETPIPTLIVSTQQPSKAKDKGKVKMNEPEKPLKKKDQIMIDEEQGELTIEERSKLFVELINERKKHFSRLKAEEKRRKPPNKTQKRKIMSTYLKNMAGFTHNQLKNKSFEEVQKAFDNTMSWINSFVPMEKDRAEGSKTRAERSSKREGEELESDKSKRHKLDEQVEVEVDNDQREAEMKMYTKIIHYDEIATDAIPLATKPPIIVDWKIIKEGKISSYHLIRADGSSKRYSSMIQMLQHIDREDLETL
nr:ribonuclease H-like domain-containing protein [Tanacetum cinerariifolium]